jgi:hypothetical protein
MKIRLKSGVTVPGLQLTIPGLNPEGRIPGSIPGLRLLVNTNVHSCTSTYSVCLRYLHIHYIYHSLIYISCSNQNPFLMYII